MKKLFLMLAVALCVVGCDESDEGATLYDGMVNSFAGTTLDEATLVAGLFSGVVTEVDAYSFTENGWRHIWCEDGYQRYHGWVFYNDIAYSCWRKLLGYEVAFPFQVMVEWQYDEATRYIHLWHKESDRSDVFRVSYYKFPDLILDEISMKEGVEKVDIRHIYRIVEQDRDEFLSEFPSTYEDVVKWIEELFGQ